ncbi:response regulator receiver domain [Rhizobium multihospitium]|uniref:Response receiver domain-containing protein n=1 Tax=Rhizobium multihospitium TaxID=410764 RepID=A0A1C3XDQ4_9HYPH|nr:response regulator receiver domain [Rhizobium multihospitium]SCB50393.1 hypothetical protein GA0061103_0829 [Rhizobium multihospitium]
MPDAAYEAAVKETFETKPLRAVLMIDDEFPTFGDLARGKDDTKKFKQADRALALYEGFRKRDMICDVENDVKDVHTERFRKSDLIILDYNLGPGEDDNERSVAILRALAESKHFNTVVVYTSKPEQDEVWLEIIASLAGGWSADLDLTGDAAVHWDRLSDAKTLPTASLDAVMQFAKRGELRDLTGPVRAAAQKELTDLGVPPNLCGEIITGLIHRELARRAGKYARSERRLATGGYEGENRWLQSRNCFVAILKKVDIGEDGDDPAGIMACLSNALLAWRPNLFQILISEIQNILELEALATEDQHLRDGETQTALWFYLLDALGELDLTGDPDVKVPLMSIIDKIVDGIRRRLSSDPDLLRLASGALLGELRDKGWTKDTWPKRGESALYKGSSELTRSSGTEKQIDVMFRLNSFFSTEKFRRAHLTTGTIFREAETQTYWVTASPACDLVARQPSGQQPWAHSLHPMTSVVAILLHEVTDHRGALTAAAQGRHIFLETEDGRKVFKLENSDRQPAYEFLFAMNEGRVREENGRQVFSAARLKPALDENGQADGSQRVLIEKTYEIVDQLRGLNATRILQMAGSHLSRIGLDFVSMPSS